ncbi:MAG: 50S ribosomal protein L15 [Desulfobacterales bacterium]|nr:50S ribosomal protein L15 [Desulfobacterales bacterium]
MKLNELSPEKGSRKNRKRVGRGVGSGSGKTAGRGTKGHNSRSGGGVRPGFEGGQMPIHRRLPKRGFTNIFKRRFQVINIKDLSMFDSGSVVDEAELRRMGMIKGKKCEIKLLGNGEIDFPLTVKIHKITKSAQQKIEAGGGNVEVL